MDTKNVWVYHSMISCLNTDSDSPENFASQLYISGDTTTVDGYNEAYIYANDNG